MKKPKQCNSCEAEITSATENHRFTESGLDNVTLEGITVHRCPNCGGTGFTIPKLAPLMRSIARALAEKGERLSPKEIRFLRKHLDLGSAECAEQLGVDPSTMSRYENVESPLSMSRQTERLLRLLVLLAIEVARDEIHLERMAVEEPRAKASRLILRPHRQGWEWRWDPAPKAVAA